MIDFSLPENVQAQLQMTKMVAEQVMRAHQRYVESTHNLHYHHNGDYLETEGNVRRKPSLKKMRNES